MRTGVDIWVPPRWVRLLVVTPIVYAGCLIVTILSPLLHLILAVPDVFDRQRRWRFTRIGGIGIAFCVAELIGLTIAFGLWVGSGFGWKLHSPTFQRAHNRVFGWWLEAVTRALRFFIGFDLDVRGPRITGPILAFTRHAGPGDMFLLARTLIQVYRRQMITVGASKLLWDPFFDHVVKRTPSVFLAQNPASPTEALTSLAEECRSMSADSVMIMCPEGGNWTPRRWEQAISRLEERGQHDRAVMAAEMRHVLPPRTAGAVAAMHARPDLTVVFIAHAGLDDLTSLRELWHHVPLRRRVEVAYWAVPQDEIPRDRAAATIWLFGEWAKVNAWIAERTGEGETVG